MRPSLWNPQDQSPSTQRDHMRLFALQATEQLGKAISHRLGQPLASHEEREFEDGEHKARPIDDVSGKDAYVIQSLHGGPSMSANDKLCRLLFFIGALKDAGASRVTAVVPYFCATRAKIAAPNPTIPSLADTVSVAAVLLLTEATMTELPEPKKETQSEPNMAM